ncbi:potassium channel subfamily K member 2-like [Lineus longissimus]|uniref:potassium channel subfamily K member 2-like n=1 Tax=Lineus longissimus TaxID=88925 RepID=UPI002B4E18B1
MDGKRLLFLCILLVVYICIGAGLFTAVEHWKEKAIREELTVIYNEFVANYSCVNETELKHLISRLDHAKGDGARMVDPEDRSYVWEYASALCFCITVITTIGYGDMVPQTVLGQCIVVGYALLGIPLCLIVLGAIGERLTNLGRNISNVRISRHAAFNKAIMTIVLIIIGVCFLFIIPSLVLMSIEEWTFFTCMYYCFITLTTIGFGTYVPGETDFPPYGWKRDFYKIAVYVWILTGLAYLSLVVQILIHVISERAEQVSKKATEKVVDFKKASVKFTKRKSKAGLDNASTDQDTPGVPNRSLSLEYDDELGDRHLYEDLCEKCRQIMIANDHNVQLVKVSKRGDDEEPEENGVAVIIADEQL